MSHLFVDFLSVYSCDASEKLFLLGFGFKNVYLALILDTPGRVAGKILFCTF